ncbi:ABC transporter permease [Chitinophaga ginsengisoli]|uniref:Putative ABC transport system permease protein n=1 Tax=Chitinophaga ginsengisoli TaxID=363837 RepID=A0A2P8GHP0_9BACT|nr:ABC transporter permease [Chitinophaga ginsengisoli]PSL33450.1 putative ABC transport system permease protein [Chitinophaga ginsengisoli]
MLKNFLRIALRHITRNKIFSFINIAGFSIGLATCLLIMLYILDEHRYDKHQEYGDRSYRIAAVNNKGENWVASSAPLAFSVKDALPEVEQVARLLTFSDISRMLFQYKEGTEQKQLFESNGYYVDSTFFQIFSYNFIYGNALTALNTPNSLVICDDIARKFFGPVNPVGKQLTINTAFGPFNYTVTGVFNGKTTRSHIPARYFLSMRNNDMWNWTKQQTSWLGNNIFYTYVKLKKGTDAKRFEAKLQSFFNERTAADMKAAGFSQRLYIQPVPDIYLHSSAPNEIGTNGNIIYLYILGSIAAFILVIACVNFMNLSTASAEKRAREVGLRKVLGAGKGALVRQFIGESFLMSLMALILAFALVLALLPYFNILAQKEISLFDNPYLLLWIIALTIAAGLLAGAYPAFYLSAFNPISVLKGKILNNFSAVAIRRGLVVFQFTISICLIFAAIVIRQQLHYLKNQSLGFRQEQQLILPLGRAFLNSENYYTSLKNELTGYPQIKAISSGSAYPGTTNMSDMLFFPKGGSKSDIVDIYLATVEKDYIETLGFQVLNGRTFSKDFPADSASIILNETAVKALGYTAANAVGRKIYYDFGQFRDNRTIVGVVKDFNFASLHNPIQPYAFTTNTFGNQYTYVIINAATDNYSDLLQKIGQVWKKLFPTVPFEYSFLDQDFQRNYEKEQRAFLIISYFTIIAIFIACLGLFGLAIFSAEQRKREIGIRKVLGASVRNVVVLLSKDFIQLVLIAFVIASPLAWYAMDKWLSEFAFHIQISWLTFIAVGILAVFIALLTVSSQAAKAALTNPVKTLKAE